MDDSQTSTQSRQRNGTSISVVTACNEKYLPYIAVVAASLAASRLPASRVELTVLHDGISPSGRERVEQAAPGIPVTWSEVDDAVYAAAGVTPTDLIRGPHYFRCLMGTVLPATLRRCVYLDGDTLVRGDLGELWATDLRGATVGAALDYFLPRTGDAIAPWQELGLDPDAEYFNSGVMVIDLDAWRAADVGKRVLDICVRHREHLLAQGKWPQHDQFGLNAVLHRSWHRISQNWNYLAEMEPHEPQVVHYCGGGKPDSPTCRPEFSAWFHATLRRTGFAGWRP